MAKKKQGISRAQSTKPDSTTKSGSDPVEVPDVEALAALEPDIEPSLEGFDHIFEQPAPEPSALIVEEPPAVTREVCVMIVSPDGSTAEIAVNHNDDEVLVEFDGKNVYKGGTPKEKEMILCFLLQSGPESMDKAAKNFARLKELANGRNVPLLDLIAQSVDQALKEGAFDCLGAPIDRQEKDECYGLPGTTKHKEAQQLEALIGYGNLLKLADVARERGCGNRTAFRVGIEKAIEMNMI